MKTHIRDNHGEYWKFETSGGLFQINATNVRNRQFVEDILANTIGQSMCRGDKVELVCEKKTFLILHMKTHIRDNHAEYRKIETSGLNPNCFEPKFCLENVKKTHLNLLKNIWSDFEWKNSLHRTWGGWNSLLTKLSFVLSAPFCGTCDKIL